MEIPTSGKIGQKWGIRQYHSSQSGESGAPRRSFFAHTSRHG